MDDPATAFGLGGRPLWFVLLALWGIVLVRSHATYWLGRAVTHGTELETRHRVGPRWWLNILDRIVQWTTSPAGQRSIGRVHKYGPYAVAPAYLTVGLQTVTVLSAGLVQMPYRRFVPASLIGGAGWSVIWSTVGLATLWGVARLVATSGWGLTTLVLVLVAAVLVAALRHRRNLTDHGVARSTAAP